MRGARVPGGRVTRAFLGLFAVLGRLALGSGPIGAFGLGRLARGTEAGPMVPIIFRVFSFYFVFFSFIIFFINSFKAINNLIIYKRDKHFF